jgi:Putative beta barrel porin-7 (BBP7)
MRLHIRTIVAGIGLLTAIHATNARAQIDLPFGPENYDCDMQLFAPAEIDLNDEVYHESHGYYFHYDKVLWSYSGEKVLIGDPSVTIFAENIYGSTNPDGTVNQNSLDQGTLPNPYRITNGIDDAYPDAGFAAGNRFELGYKSCEGAGWSITALQGPDINQHNVFGGFGDAQPNTNLVGEGNMPGTPVLGSNTGAIPAQTQTNPLLDPDFTNNSGTGPGAFAGDKAFGFGSVHVNFSTPPGYLLGFQDYLNYVAGAAIGTQGGPILYVGNYGRVQEPNVPGGNNNTVPTFTFFRLTDDINENGIPGAIGIAITVNTPNGPITEFTTLTDFGDLHEFNIAFERLEVHSRTNTEGVEGLWTHELSNRHYMAKHQNNQLELSAGGRFFRLYDEFRWDGFGGILGKAYSDTVFKNQIVGPEVALKWTNQRQRWQLSADTRFTFGYNIEDWSQSNGIGEELIPGATNRLLYAQPTFTHHTLTMDDFSPLGELRLEAAYYLTQSFSLKLGYNGMAIANVKRAATSVQYALPDMGYRDSGTQTLLVNGATFGIEFVH